MSASRLFLTVALLFCGCAPQPSTGLQPAAPGEESHAGKEGDPRSQDRTPGQGINAHFLDAILLAPKIPLGTPPPLGRDRRHLYYVLDESIYRETCPPEMGIFLPGSCSGGRTQASFHDFSFLLTEAVAPGYESLRAEMIALLQKRDLLAGQLLKLSSSFSGQDAGGTLATAHKSLADALERIAETKTLIALLDGQLLAVNVKLISAPADLDLLAMKEELESEQAECHRRLAGLIARSDAAAGVVTAILADLEVGHLLSALTAEQLRIQSAMTRLNGLLSAAFGERARVLQVLRMIVEFEFTYEVDVDGTYARYGDVFAAVPESFRLAKLGVLTPDESSSIEEDSVWQVPFGQELEIPLRIPRDARVTAVDLSFLVTALARRALGIWIKDPAGMQWPLQAPDPAASFGFFAHQDTFRQLLVFPTPRGRGQGLWTLMIKDSLASNLRPRIERIRLKLRLQR